MVNYYSLSLYKLQQNDLNMTVWKLVKLRRTRVQKLFNTLLNFIIYYVLNINIDK